MPPRFWALVPCAGTGTRAGGEGPKQYRLLTGRPLVQHTLAAFAGVARLAGTLVVVAHGDGFEAGGGLPGPLFTLVPCGGATRAETVANGLQALQARGAAPDDWVLVHDAARCMVTPVLVDALIDACVDDPVGGLLAQPVADTLKTASAEGRVAGTLDRRGRWLAQTPQMFRLGPLAQALRHAGAAVTDEAGAMEALGQQPLLVPGSAQNFKVTWPEDFALAEAVLAARVNQQNQGPA
jgi:2-C-methyl-D-erythritol 4-phosphate cytidylyltransferase